MKLIQARVEILLVPQHFLSEVKKKRREIYLRVHGGWVSWSNLCIPFPATVTVIILRQGASILLLNLIAYCCTIHIPHPSLALSYTLEDKKDTIHVYTSAYTIQVQSKILHKNWQFSRPWKRGRTSLQLCEKQVKSLQLLLQYYYNNIVTSSV